MSKGPRRTLLLVAAAIVLAGIVLRVISTGTAFWIDEVLTLAWGRAHGYWELVSHAATKHDNNHVLNSMWLRFVESYGEPSHWWPYRVLALVTGSCVPILMGLIGWRRSPLEGALGAGFGALSCVMIHYSSEARGYGPVCCFALLAYLAFERGLKSGGVWPVLALALCAVLGVLAHSTFGFAYIGLLGWTAFAWRSGTPLRRLAELHAFPVILLAFYWFTRIRGMQIGGGPEFGLVRVFENTMAHVVGWTYDAQWTGTAVAVAAGLLVVAEVVLRMRERAGESLGFYLTILIVTPLLTAFVLKPDVIYMRYFLVCVPFLMLLVAGLLARLCRSGLPGRVACALLIVAMLGGNGWRLHGMLTVGRGQYLEALEYIVANDPDPEVAVTGDAQLHISSLVGFYARFLAKPVRYVHQNDVRSSRWLISELQVVMPVLRGEDRVSTKAPWGEVYDLVAVFPYASISGGHWHVFARSR